MKTFKEYIVEVGKQKVKFTAFDIMVDDEEMFTTRADNGADVIDKKLKTAKFKKVLNKIVILRHNEDGTDDVTKLFIR